MLYVKLLKALYGCLKSALLFYKKLAEDLKSQEFIINPYDPCVANKQVNGHQLTVVWHVDDLKISHVDKNEVTKFINWLKSMYQDDKVGKVKVSRGKEHKYLGIILDYSTPGCIKVDMQKYVLDMIATFPIAINKSAATPASQHLFEVRDDCKKLDDKHANLFHTITAKGLFACKRARPDIQTAIAFLTTRVVEPDQDDWKKLERLLQYLYGTKDMVLTLKADNLQVLKWYVDAAHLVHKDMKGHTGAVMTLGKGGVYNTSTKQKINTRSSTESELVGVDDVIPQVLWMRSFLESQGYSSSSTIIYQDNKSAILLKKNGRFSSSK